MKKLILLLILCVSCKVHYATNYKIITPNGNFYTNDFKIVNDSIFIVEFNGDKIRRTGAFKMDQVIIKGN
jgi:hypothetical protein